MATEVRKLAESSRGESDKIKPYLDEISNIFKSINSRVNTASTGFSRSTELNAEVSQNLSLIADIITELNEKSSQFTEQTKSILTERKMEYAMQNGY